ncbi:putative bifunctional diguanylate cyclase/phosphodiesterase [Planctomycetota bacterium]
MQNLQNYACLVRQTLERLPLSAYTRHPSTNAPMFNWTNRTNQLSSVFVESINTDELRSRRVWRLVMVLWLTWNFFVVFFWLRGNPEACQICVVDSVAHLLILVSCWRWNNYRDIMNLNLAASAVGLFFVATSDPSLTSVMFFFPVAILVASQLIGIGSAFLWFVVNIVAFAAFFVFIHGVDDPYTDSTFDRLMIIVVVAGCVFFCCHQGEEYYKERTRGLLELSRNLKQKSETLHELATTDALTGLCNRLQFQERLRAAVHRPEQVALFLVDMDGFKEINDALGHPTGDKTLVEIASRLSAEFGDCAEVARFGGDEFCIILPHVNDCDEAAEYAQRIWRLLTRRYVLDAVDFPLGASVGFALSPLHTQSDEQLLAYADTAMFYAKENRLGYACYDAEMTNRLVEYRAMQEKLSFALDRNEFFLAYQPQVNLRTGKVIGVEALLRWKHDGVLIFPEKFVPLLEQSGEIKTVGKWIIRESCKQLAAWDAAGFDVEVSINVSAIQFNDDEFCRCIADAIEEYGINPSSLDFEITEGLLVDDVSQATEKLHEVKKMGASISIDDFGTGYSSLAYLRQFPIDRLKIDRAFVKDIPDNDDGVIASSVIVLAKALGLKVLAEGAETEAHIEFLKANDCDEYQGYYLSRPVVADEVVNFFARPHRIGCPAMTQREMDSLPSAAIPKV